MVITLELNIFELFLITLYNIIIYLKVNFSYKKLEREKSISTQKFPSTPLYQSYVSPLDIGSLLVD